MKSSFILFTFLLVTLASFGQKAKFKNDIASIDGEPYLKWEVRRGSEASISSLTSDSDEIFISWQSYNDPNEINSGNPKGAVRWIEVNFLTLEKKCEIRSGGNKSVAKLFYQDELYVDGVLNEANVDKFVRKYGMKFSENRPNQGVNITINN